MSNINLDAARKERQQENPTVTFGGKTYDLPQELPFSVFKQFQRMQDEPDQSVTAMDYLLGALLGDRKDEFLEADPSLQDIRALIEGCLEGFEVEVGESQASISS